MSYLDAPRLHFAGRFQADVSTRNNVVANFGAPPEAIVDGWNVRGSGAWRFTGCRVTGGTYADGAPVTAADPAIGMALNPSHRRVAGKLVDLDPEQQLTSTIFGFEVVVGEPGGGDWLHGSLRPTTFTDGWFRTTGPGFSGMSAAFQSVLEEVATAPAPGSRLLQELAATLGAERLLSIRFNVDGMTIEPTEEFPFGRVVGTIGPARAGDPATFDLARLLRAEGGPWAQLRVPDGAGTAVVDLGNATRAVTPAGAVVPDPLPLSLAIVGPGGVATRLVGGSFDRNDPDWYPTTAGIVSIPLTGEEAAAARDARLGLATAVGAVPVLVENLDGIHLRAHRTIYRLEPHSSAAVELRATVHGRAPGKELTVDITKGGNALLVPPVRQPEDGLTVPASITLDAAGRGGFALQAGDPGNVRSVIDGQVYGVSIAVRGSDPFGAVPYIPLTIKVFDGFSAPEHPTWADVRPILGQFGRLYPVMDVILDLSDYDSVVEHAWALHHAMCALGFEDANYMPVTRDLSAARRAMICRWLASDLPRGVEPAEPVPLPEPLPDVPLHPIAVIKSGRSEHA